MHVRNLEVLDQFNVVNALQGGPTVPATVSFDVYWSDPTAIEHLLDTANSAAGTFLDLGTTIEWSARTADITFVSDPADTSKGRFARVGFEANGVFFPAM